MFNDKKNILIVDDSELIVDRLVDMIQGHENVNSINKAYTYAEADKLLNQSQPNVVFLDINLPDGNGVDLLSKIKTTYPDMRVVMFTNQTSTYYKNLCAQLGADHFVDKSTDFEMIPEILSSMKKD